MRIKPSKADASHLTHSAQESAQRGWRERGGPSVAVPDRGWSARLTLHYRHDAVMSSRDIVMMPTEPMCVCARTIGGGCESGKSCVTLRRKEVMREHGSCLERRVEDWIKVWRKRSTFTLLNVDRFIPVTKSLVMLLWVADYSFCLPRRILFVYIAWFSKFRSP